MRKKIDWVFFGYVLKMDASAQPLNVNPESAAQPASQKLVSVKNEHCLQCCAKVLGQLQIVSFLWKFTNLLALLLLNFCFSINRYWLLAKFFDPSISKRLKKAIYNPLSMQK